MRITEGIGGLIQRLRNLERSVNANRIVPGVGYKVRESTNGTVLDIDAGGGSSSGYPFPAIIQSALPNYFVCRSWDGTTEGTVDFHVAKSYNCRQPASRDYLGVTYNYTYSSITDGINDTRTSDNGTTEETQMVTPPWDDSWLIWVKHVAWSGVDVDGADLKLMEDTERCWAKVTT